MRVDVYGTILYFLMRGRDYRTLVHVYEPVSRTQFKSWPKKSMLNGESPLKLCFIGLRFICVRKRPIMFNNVILKQ